MSDNNYNMQYHHHSRERHDDSDAGLVMLHSRYGNPYPEDRISVPNDLEKKPLQSDPETSVKGDQNYLYVKTGLAHPHQVVHCMRDILNEMQLACDFVLSLVTKQDKYLGYAYIWLSNKEVFSILAGLDENGELKTKTIVDPGFEPPEISKEERIAQIWAEYDEDTSDFADIQEREERIAHVNLEYQPTLKVVPIESQIRPKYVRTAVQIEEWRDREYKRLVKESNGSDVDIDSIEVSQYGHIQFSKALRPKDNTYTKFHIMHCKNVPIWIKDKDLQKIFAVFVTGENRQGYPHIRSNQRPIRGRGRGRGGIKHYRTRSVTVSFDSKRDDGRMAIFVTRQLTVVSTSMRNRQGPVKSILHFHHPIKESKYCSCFDRT